MIDVFEVVNAICSVVDKMIEGKDKTFGVAVNIKNPTQIYECKEGQITDMVNIKWYPYSSLVTNRKPNMSKIGQIGFECYEANFHYDDSIKLPSLSEMMKTLRQSPDCQIDISEATKEEIIMEYKFIMSLK